MPGPSGQILRVSPYVFWVDCVLRTTRDRGNTTHLAFHPGTLDWTGDYLPLWSLHRVSDGSENDIDRIRYLGILMSAEGFKGRANIYV